MAGDLKDRWEASWSALQRRAFFFNRTSGQTTWSKPAEAPEYTTPAQEVDTRILDAQKAAGILPKGWAAAFDTQHQRLYYYTTSNGANGVRTWHKPFISEEELANLTRSQESENALAKAQKKAPAAAGSTAAAPDKFADKIERDPLIERVPWDSATFAHRLRDARHAVNADRFVKTLFKELFENNMKVVSCPQYHAWKKRLAKLGKGEPPSQGKSRANKATSRFGLRVPETVPVKYLDCYNALMSRSLEDLGGEPRVVFWQLMTHKQRAEQTDTIESMTDVLQLIALRFMSEADTQIVCVNPSNGRGPAGFEADPAYGDSEHDCGGAYVEGEEGCEAELCRRCPTLWPSLCRGMAEIRESEDEFQQERDPTHSVDHSPLFPYGPSTKNAPETGAERTDDGVYTPRVEIVRGSEATGFEFLGKTHRNVVNILSMAPPEKKVDEGGVRGSALTMFIAPKIMDPRNQILVMPAWGCGPPWNNNVRNMASTFAHAIKGEVTIPEVPGMQGSGMKTKMGRFYKEIHIVFGPPRVEQDATGESGNARRASARLSMAGGPKELTSDMEAFKRIFKSRKFSIAFEDGMTWCSGETPMESHDRGRGSNFEGY